MKNYVQQLNPVTNQVEWTTSAKLVVDPSNTILENVNGTKYRLCTIEVVNPKTGELFQTTAQIYENNFNKGVEAGKEYQCTLTEGTDGSGNLLFRISHLPAAQRLSLKDLGLTKMAIVPTTTVK